MNIDFYRTTQGALSLGISSGYGFDPQGLKNSIFFPKAFLFLNTIKDGPSFYDQSCWPEIQISKESNFLRCSYFLSNCRDINQDPQTEWG